MSIQCPQCGGAMSKNDLGVYSCLCGAISKPPTGHSHYFKGVANLQSLDVYRVLELFEVTNPCIQHAIKKLLVAGGRGHKDISRDIQDAIDSLERWKGMRTEDRVPMSELK